MKVRDELNKLLEAHNQKLKEYNYPAGITYAPWDEEDEWSNINIEERFAISHTNKEEDGSVWVDYVGLDASGTPDFSEDLIATMDAIGSLKTVFQTKEYVIGLFEKLPEEIKADCEIVPVYGINDDEPWYLSEYDFMDMNDASNFIDDGSDDWKMDRE